jgi:LysR family hca operon transcriptional activator
MHALQDQLPVVDVTVSSSYSPDLVEAVVRRRLDLALARKEANYDLTYRLVAKEPLIVLMPSDHPLAMRESIPPQELAKGPFIVASNKAAVLREVIETYLKKSRLEIVPAHGVDNLAMAMSLVASTRGLALMPA